MQFVLKAVLLVFGLLCFNDAKSQIKHFTVRGNVKTLKSENVQGALISIKDTNGLIVYTAFSDTNGYYVFEDTIYGDRMLKLSVTPVGGIENSVTDIDTRHLNYNQDFNIEIKIRDAGRSHYNSASTFNFKEGKSDVVSGHSSDEIAFIRSIMLDYPDICIEFQLWQLAGESDKLGRKRLKRLEQLFADKKINPDNYRINNEIMEYDKPPEDLLAKIYAKILSLDGCK